SEVKRRSADGSVGSPHARVGNCQASNKAKGHPAGWPFCVLKDLFEDSPASVSEPSFRQYSALAHKKHFQYL
ncbi:hypothetical protein K6W59_09695, partial [Erwinia amylovora]|uniref:hypothetical protein n=1 Tax=Erwinia amylovora TaxID=552 RepID=UPI001CC08CC7